MVVCNSWKKCRHDSSFSCDDIDKSQFNVLITIHLELVPFVNDIKSLHIWDHTHLYSKLKIFQIKNIKSNYLLSLFISKVSFSFQR